MYLRKDTNHFSIIKNFLNKVISGKMRAYTSVLTMDELFYRLLLAKIKDKYDDNPLNILRQKTSEVISEWSPMIKTSLEELSHLSNLYIVGIEDSDFSKMLSNILEYKILPRDAIHVAVMQRLGITDLVSDDSGFDEISWINRHWVFRPVM